MSFANAQDKNRFKHGWGSDRQRYTQKWENSDGRWPPKHNSYKQKNKTKGKKSFLIKILNGLLYLIYYTCDTQVGLNKKGTELITPLFIGKYAVRLKETM